MAEEAGRHEAAVDIAPTLRKREEMNVAADSFSPLLFSLGLQPMKWCGPHLGEGFLN